MSAETTPEVSIDQRVTSTLASQLANENLGLRQQVIKLSIENEELQAKVAELEAVTATAKKASSKSK